MWCGRPAGSWARPVPAKRPGQQVSGPQGQCRGPLRCLGVGEGSADWRCETGPRVSALSLWGLVHSIYGAPAPPVCLACAGTRDTAVTELRVRRRKADPPRDLCLSCGWLQNWNTLHLIWGRGARSSGKASWRKTTPKWMPAGQPGKNRTREDSEGSIGEGHVGRGLDTGSLDG